jgi:hypothetical protein
LQFIAAIVSSVAWPVAALGMTVVLRGPLAVCLPSASRRERRELEFDFQRELAEIETQAQAANFGARADAAEAGGELLAEVDAVAAVSPLAAIPLAWTVVESEIGKSLERLGIQVRSLRQPTQYIRALTREGYIGAETATILNQLRQLRNKAAHAAHTRVQISRSGAEEYARLAAEVVGTLRGIQRPGPQRESNGDSGLA